MASTARMIALAGLCAAALVSAAQLHFSRPVAFAAEQAMHAGSRRSASLDLDLRRGQGGHMAFLGGSRASQQGRAHMVRIAQMTAPSPAPVVTAKPKKHLTPDDLREQYVAQLAEKPVAVVEERTLGSLWSAHNRLVDLASDYRASRLHDTITIVASVLTTAAQSGTVNTSRAFNTSSAITGIMGQTPAAVNPLLAANSTTTLKGSGQTASNTSFQTSLTGTVIAVLPSGNLIVEAQRQIFMNNQHEDVLIRGMIRPGDIGAQNTIPSSALSNLQIEMKGKGIIADGTRPPNKITRAVLWLLGF